MLEINGKSGGYCLGSYREFAVPEALSDVAEVGWRFDAIGSLASARARQAVHRVLPETGVSLTFECRRGRGGRIEDLALFVMGPITRPRFFNPDARTEMVGIRLRAESCRELLGMRAGDLLDRAYPAPRARWTAMLVRRLARTRDAGEAALALVAAAASQPRSTRSGRAGRLAHDTLERLRRRDSPPASLVSLAREFGMSPRHLRRVVADSCGLGIKWFQRVRRLHRAVSAASGVRQPYWCSLAADAGYYDQAHMIREFRRLSGLTPAQLLAERAPRES